ncbi:uncharacterized protein LOC112526127 [Cynara cardunculus var. scolymus]|uniref:DUF7054 domain-containing protein n=1 Tax=Cynara cardunculus var. scolymus TaxID=59895 RepID=A0A103YHM3_CYNCS|nr:uncharacterized protein LOC112526127 [Cynara cardunculus var. scolymus]KVI09291.1 hypothetical protein Ccrd_012330 [Cynara cardunculus var. scolymus]
MSTNKSSRKGQDKNKKLGRLTEKAMSFHGQAAEDMVGKLRRPRTVPDLISGTGRVASSTGMVRPKLTKLLLNVTVQRSLGPVHVLISLESTVSDLVAAALQQYSKESRRPILPSLNPSGFELHYSQFSLESLDPDEKLIELGSRNFFLCPKPSVTAGGSGDDKGEIGFDYAVTTTTSSCSTEATNTGGGWLRFMNFSL